MLKLIKQAPLSHFSDVVSAYEREIRRIMILSPWIISHESNDFIPLVRILDVVRKRRMRFTILTRKPDRPSHERALQLISAVGDSEILLLNTLHAKLYLIEGNGIRAAFFGSANFTPGGEYLQREIAADIRSTRASDDAAEFIAQLFSYAFELLQDPRTLFVKKYNQTY